MQIFWGEWFLKQPDEELKRVMESEQANLAYHSWFVFDFDLGGGRTALDLFLEREGRRLSSGERDFLDDMGESHLRLYEVLEVKTGQGFDLRDLWDDRQLWVRERPGTRHIVRWDLVAGRIGAAGDGGTVFETLPYLFPAADKDDLVSGLRKSHRLFTSAAARSKHYRLFQIHGARFPSVMAGASGAPASSPNHDPRRGPFDFHQGHIRGAGTEARD